MRDELADAGTVERTFERTLERRQERPLRKGVVDAVRCHRLEHGPSGTAVEHGAWQIAPFARIVVIEPLAVVGVAHPWRLDADPVIVAVIDGQVHRRECVGDEQHEQLVHHLFHRLAAGRWVPILF